MKPKKELDTLGDNEVIDYLNNYKFKDPDIDNIKDFDYHARELFIRKQITKLDYMMIEHARLYVDSLSKFLTKKGKATLKEVFEYLYG